MAGRTCVFCGKRGVSNEHVIPAWVGKALDKHLRPGRRWTHTQGDITFEDEAFQFKVKRVCRDCNHGWMDTEIEQPNRPYLEAMMDDAALTLSNVGQSGIATWVIKTHMMMQYQVRTRPVRAEQLAWLYQHRTPPPNSQVWLGATTRRRRNWINGRHLSQEWYSYDPDAPPPYPADAHILDVENLTLAIDHLVMVAIRRSGPEDNFLLQLPPALQETFVQIWPIRPFAVTWPPPNLLHGEKEIFQATDDLVRDGAAVFLSGPQFPPSGDR